MTIARITERHPSATALPSLAAAKPTAIDNSQPCGSRPVRAIEDSVVYVATRCQMDMGGSCRVSDLTNADSPAVMYMRVPTEAYTSTVTIYAGVASDVAGNTIAIGVETVTIQPADNYQDITQRQDIVVPITTGSGDKSDLGTSDLTFTVTVASGTVRVWYVGPRPVPLPPGQVTVS